MRYAAATDESGPWTSDAKTKRSCSRRSTTVNTRTAPRREPSTPWGSGDDSHCSDVREADALRGWPETRCAPAPSRMALFIPRGPCDRRQLDSLDTTAAVHFEARAGDHRRLVGGKKDRRVRDVLRAVQTA